MGADFFAFMRDLIATEEAVVIGCVVQVLSSEQSSMSSPDLVVFRVSVSFLQHKRRSGR
jgi:hypothetical protein